MSNAIAQEELPLLDLFTRLQEAGLPLGIDEYCLLLRALQSGFGTGDRETLADLCRTLWVKSSDDEHLFNYHFEQLVKEASIEKSTSNSEDSRLQPNVSEPQEKGLPNWQNNQGNKLPDTTTFTLASAELMEIGDEIQVAEAVQIRTQQDKGTSPNRFTQSDEYFPVTRRQMKQSWRHLRRLVREGLPTELDIEATIALTVQQGVLLEPVLVPRRVNRTELLLLLDQKGSMMPFHALSQRLAETAQRGGRLGRAGVYYFHNCPTHFLYRDSTQQQAEPLSNVLAQLRTDHSGVLIFSDAGAARGGYSEERLDLTEHFLSQLRQSVRYIAWLNPMPQERWVGTTAEEIGELVPMFEISRLGMDQAIDVLRGKSASGGLE
ncbi:hypothetical protein H6G89_23375 [Oscillatoria sp. FACHB-1407]|uniref:hypothetical protein n=1 Tax=Oscillatoria sp. FACHB-1407 TaxID=2692847 RepID=UPI001682091D|nr:hypothetical protein [Oscillatoria sp. FACHB-1407]MBD2463947.1 hypothetical protein [Oscillatoria sp. FACHB-1407]